VFLVVLSPGLDLPRLDLQVLHALWHFVVLRKRYPPSLVFQKLRIERLNAEYPPVKGAECHHRDAFVQVLVPDHQTREDSVDLLFLGVSLQDFFA